MAARPRKKKNYRFVNRSELPFLYRRAYLAWIDKIAPEVRTDLFSLLPLRNRVFGGKASLRNKTSPRWPRGVGWLCIENDSDDSLISPEDRTCLNLLTLAEITGNDRYYSMQESDLAPDEVSLLKDFHSLRSQYSAFIRRYSLETDWLRNDLFSLLDRHAENPALWNRLHLAASFGYAVLSGEPFTLECDPWSVSHDSDAFRRQITVHFQQALDAYIEATAQMFREHNYKCVTKGYDTDVVKWLVHWNVRQTPKAQILELIRKERPSTMTEDTLNENFRDLERKYGLPYRRLKRGKSRL